MISGEIHPARIPKEYWRHRIQTAKAMGCNTIIDMTNYKKGIVWVNGHNLGRYWEIGPQTRLYCPAPWLKAGANEIVVFDLLQNESKPVSGTRILE